MGYVQKHLHDGESVIHLNNLHWIIFGWPVFWLVQSVMLGFTVEGAAVIAVVILLLASISILSRWIDLKTSEFAVTDSRIIMKTGLIRRHSVELNLTQVAESTLSLQSRCSEPSRSVADLMRAVVSPNQELEQYRSCLTAQAETVRPQVERSAVNPGRFTQTRTRDWCPNRAEPR